MSSHPRYDAAMRWNRAHNLTSVSSALAVLLLVVAHGGILPRPALADDPQPQPAPGTPENDDERRKSDSGQGATAPLDLRAGLPRAMLIRLHAEDPTVTCDIPAANATCCIAGGRPDPSPPRGAAASAALAGAYRLISLRRDEYLALPLVDPFGEAPAPRDPALRSSISILGPPSA